MLADILLLLFKKFKENTAFLIIVYYESYFVPKISLSIYMQN